MKDISSILVPYQELLKEVDNWFVECSLAAGKQISCQRGCSACCRGLFDITLLDAWLLRNGFEQLPEETRMMVRSKAMNQIEGIRNLWPDFDHPYLFNTYPEEEWDQVMPEEDETPCALLGQDGLCLVYNHRPMTCRLNGIPLVDEDGEVLFDEWCSMNFQDTDPLEMPELRTHFNDIFKQEQLLFREFTKRLLGTPFNELDTVIPASVLINFSDFNLPEQLWKPSSF